MRAQAATSISANRAGAGHRVAEDAFRTALVALIPKLRAYATGLARSSSEADDLVQDALVRAWRYRASFNPETNLNAWMFRILRNEFFGQAARRRATVEDVDGEHASRLCCEPEQEWRVQYAELLKAVRKLPADSRDALLLVAGAGLTHQEAAAVCGCDPNTMKQRLHRARKRLAEMTESEAPAAAEPRSWRPQSRARAGLLGALAIAASASVAHAAPAKASGGLAAIKAQLAEQSQQIADQERRLAEQAQMIRAQQAKLDGLLAEQDATLAAIRGAGSGRGPQGSAGVRTFASADQTPPNTVVEGRLPVAPVGEGPQPKSPQELAALPPMVGVLTPPGKLILDPSFEYVRTSNNRLVFRGVEIVPGIQLGVIEASDVARDTAVATIAARYGLTSRLEVEARVPYVYRHDRLSLIAQTNPDFEPEREMDDHSLGDVEVAARYQLTSGRNGRPIFVANARAKSPTGVSPFEGDFDEFGVATSLATGSGFWSVEGGVTMLYPSDPAVIFAGLTYLHNIGRDIDRDIGAVRVGRVEPGDSIGAQAGFGLSLNPRFSVSFGYSHNYIFPTKSQIGGTEQQTRALQVGSLQMGWSFRLTEGLTLNNSFEFGVTSDAPDMRVVVRLPIRF